jgi:hypothetical protein
MYKNNGERGMLRKCITNLCKPELSGSYISGKLWGLVIVLSHMIVMLIVNAYFSTLYPSPAVPAAYKSLIQALKASFDIFWRIFIMYVMSGLIEDRLFRIWCLFVINIFSYIGAPLITTLFVSDSCFKSIFVPRDPIITQYTYYGCERYYYDLVLGNYCSSYGNLDGFTVGIEVGFHVGWNDGVDGFNVGSNDGVLVGLDG